MKIRHNGITLVIHWPTFGPYHISRIQAAQKYLQHKQISVVGLEIASKDDTYLWKEYAGQVEFERYTIFPAICYKSINSAVLIKSIFHSLNLIRPDAVAVNGYGSIDSLTIMSWCRYRWVPLILMSESKEDDATRKGWKEYLKGGLVRQFKSAICGGAVHKEYLEKLGLPGDRIFLGYDVVDNEYFVRQAEKVRENPDDHRHLPGLGRSKPYFLASARFIKRKNLAFLLHAYERYRQKMKISGNDGHTWGLIVLGDGGERSSLENTIKELSLDGVTLAGIQQIESLPAYYAFAGAFIHPALQDQWGLVVNEAMASGLPVLVSSGCGCVSELVENGLNGFVFDPTDLVQLSDLMYQISNNEYDLTSMRKSSLEKINYWGTDKFAQGIYQAFCVAVKS